MLPTAPPPSWLRENPRKLKHTDSAENARLFLHCSNVKNYEKTSVNNLFYHTCIRHQRGVLNVVVVR